MQSTVQASTAEATIYAAELSTSHSVVEREGSRLAHKVCEVTFDGKLVRARVRGQHVIESRSYEPADPVVVLAARGRRRSR